MNKAEESENEAGPIEGRNEAEEGKENTNNNQSNDGEIEPQQETDNHNNKMEEKYEKWNSKHDL